MPNTQQFVVIKGSARSPEDFGLSISIGDGDNKSSFYLDPWMGAKDNAAILKHMRDAMQQALEFYEKALNLPMPKVPKTSLSEDFPTIDWESIFPQTGEKPKAKKAATKKKAAKK